jgi:hypothetical protein
MQTLTLTLKNGKTVWLRIPSCKGLCSYVRDDLSFDENDYAIIFLSIDKAQAISDNTIMTDLRRLELIQSALTCNIGNSNSELPFISGYYQDSLEIRTEAYVVPALINLGAESIPFKVHKDFILHLLGD